jgi:diguanylate cyclase (GGDEF)-like protein/PAS domain S-box-containing protein
MDNQNGPRRASQVAAGLFFGAGSITLLISLQPFRMGAAGVNMSFLQAVCAVSFMTAAVVWRCCSTRFPIIMRVATALWGLLLLVGAATVGHYSSTSQASVVFPVFAAMVIVWLGLTCPRGYAASSAPVVIAASIVAASAPGSKITVINCVLVIAASIVVAETVAWAMSEALRREARLIGLAQTDALTGLLNRAAFTERLEAACASGERIHLAFIDLNGFKDVNDTFGHQQGDQVLSELAARLLRAVRSEDVVGRFGGDEFVILFRDAPTGESSELLVERIRGAFDAPWPTIGPSTISASIGIVEDPSGALEPEDLLREADNAMYSRKHGVTAAPSTVVMTSRSLAYYRAGVEGLGGSFTVLRVVGEGDDLDWRIEEANALVRSKFSSITPDPVGQLLSTLDTLADNSVLKGIYLRALESQERQEAELQIAIPQIDQAWRRLVVMPIDSCTVAVMTFDISKQKAVEQAIIDSDNRSRSIVESAADAIITIDAGGKILSLNRAAETVFGVSAVDTIGDSYHRFASEDSLIALHRAFADRESDAHLEVMLTRSNAEAFVAHVSISTFETSTGTVSTAIVRDVSEVKEIESTLRAAQEALDRAVDTSDIGLLLLDQDLRMFRVNQTAMAMLGHVSSELVGRSIMDIIQPDEVDEVRRYMSGLLTHGDNPRSEISIVGSDQSVRVLVTRGMTVFDQSDHPMYLILQLVDATERKREEERRHFEATHDSLTGQLNRAGFLEAIEAELADGVAVLSIDLDRFQRVNDALGRATGDAFLVAIGNRFAGALRPKDAVARIGGDEFGVLFTDVRDEETANRLSRRITQSLVEPVPIDEVEGYVSASIGVALGTGARCHPAELLRMADVALFRAKERGRGRSQTYDPDFLASRIHPFETVNALHRALERNELLTYFQPIVDLDTGHLIGHEALLRWGHPGRGLIPPDEFIGLAEESGLIVPIGDWVLESACRQTARWNASNGARVGTAPISIHVNVSPVQLDDPTLATRLLRIIDKTGLPTSSVCLEITEGSLMRDPVQSAATLEALRKGGAHISIDDFGTGHSSLGYIRDFPIDSLKIDRTFVSHLGVSSADTAIVEATINLAHALDIVAIAEGLETTGQLQALRNLGCDLAQGYLLAHPVPAEVAETDRSLDLTQAAHQLR